MLNYSEISGEQEVWMVTSVTPQHVCKTVTIHLLLPRNLYVDPLRAGVGIVVWVPVMYRHASYCICITASIAALSFFTSQIPDSLPTAQPAAANHESNSTAGETWFSFFIFNSRFPDGSGLAGTRMYPFWVLLEQRWWTQWWQLEL